MGQIINTKLAQFAAELEESYSALVEKYWDGGLEYFGAMDLRVYTDDGLTLKFWEEGVEFYPEKFWEEGVEFYPEEEK